jgi:membrane protein DedA with SNARE-associated domain
MWSWIDTAATSIAQYPAWALAAAFLAAIIEAVAVFGTVIPGTFILMGIAGAAAIAGQSMIPFLIVAVIGAVIGDFLSYWCGRYFQSSIQHCWPFAQRPYLLAEAHRFFERYGTYSVALCRFVPVLRSTVPLAAGLAGMSTRRFVLANVTSALVWAPAHVYPAQFAGLSIDELRNGAWATAALWGGALVVCCAGAWLIHRRFARAGG